MLSDWDDDKQERLEGLESGLIRSCYTWTTPVVCKKESAMLSNAQITLLVFS